MMGRRIYAAVATALVVVLGGGCAIAKPGSPIVKVTAPSKPTVKAPVAPPRSELWGVNTHMGYVGYRDRVPTVTRALRRLHVVWVRDNSETAPGLLKGFKVQFVLDTSNETEALRRVKVAMDGGAAAIELRNEPDYSGTRDEAHVRAVAELNVKVIDYVKGRNPRMPIVGSGLGLPREEWPEILASPQGQDYGNLHIYRGGNVDAGGWRYWRSQYYKYNLAGAKKWMVTETGTHGCMECKGHVGTSPAVAASRIVSDFRDLINDGASRVFTYELLDEDKAGTQGAFGLFEEDGIHPKPQAREMAKYLVGS